MNKYQELLQVLEKEHQFACGKAMIEETARAKVYFQLLKNLTDKETPKKPVVIQDDIFGDYHLVCPNCGQGAIVILKRRPSLYEYEVMYYSQEHQSFGTLTSFVDPFIDGEEIEVFIPRDDIVAWTSFQRIDEEHKEKTAEQMFNDLDYKKRIKDGCIKFERHTENVDEGLIEFDLALKTVYVSWFREPKDITIAELRAINKQCEELNWL